MVVIPERSRGVIYRGRPVANDEVIEFSRDKVTEFSQGDESTWAGVEESPPFPPCPPTPPAPLRLAALVLLGVTAVVGVTAQTPLVKSTAPPSSLSPSSSPTPQTQPRRLKINLTINNPEELRVREGDRVSAGQVIADRPQERARLDRERRSVLLSRANLEQTRVPQLKPAPQLRELPPVSFAVEESEIQQAELKFSQAQRNLQNALGNDPFITARAKVDKAKSAVESAYRAFELQQRKLDAVNGLRGLPPEMLEHETEKLRQKQSELNGAQSEYDFYAAEYRQVESQRNGEIAELQNKIQMARSELEISQARLRTAKEEREKAEYDHRITLARRAEEENQQAIAASNQKLEREFKLAQLNETLSGIEEKLNAIVQVKSPYSGKISRIKVDKQNNGLLSITLYLVSDVSISGR